jgi:hypothetical protein
MTHPEANPEAYIHLSRFKVRNPLADPAFYTAIGTAVALYHESSNPWAAAASVAAWLMAHGYMRGKAVEAAGMFAANLEAETELVGIPMLPEADHGDE